MRIAVMVLGFGAESNGTTAAAPGHHLDILCRNKACAFPRSYSVVCCAVMVLLLTIVAESNFMIVSIAVATATTAATAATKYTCLLHASVLSNLARSKLTEFDTSVLALPQ